MAVELSLLRASTSETHPISTFNRRAPTTDGALAAILADPGSEGRSTQA